MSYVIQQGIGCNMPSATLSAIATLVCRGGAVADTAQMRLNLRRAEWVRLALDANDAPIGCIVAKHPNPDYASRLLEDKCGLLASDYPLELGYMYIEPAYRTRALARYLFEGMLHVVSNSGLWLTTRDRDITQHVLFRYNFRKQTCYTGQNQQRLALYTRTPTCA